MQRACFAGYQVFYFGFLPNFPPGEITIRHLLLLWTGDHPAQCEVCKTKQAGGKKGCHRCHISGRKFMVSQIQSVKKTITLKMTITTSHFTETVINKVILLANS